MSKQPVNPEFEEKITMVLKSIKRPRFKESVTFTMRMDPEEYDYIQKMADKYARGNISFWIRYASMHYRPDDFELKEAW